MECRNSRWLRMWVNSYSDRAVIRTRSEGERWKNVQWEAIIDETKKNREDLVGWGGVRGKVSN